MAVPMLRFKTDDGTNFPEWENTLLGSLVHVLTFKRIFNNQTSEYGDVPFFKIGTFGKVPDAYISSELYEEYKSKYPYPNVGNILISASGSIGRTIEYNGERAYYQDSNIIWLSHDERISDGFLKQFLSQVKWKGLEGSTIKRLYNKTINETPIYLPSIEEQHKIADCLSTVDSIITNCQAEVEAWKKYKKGVMQQLFSQEVRFKADDGSVFPDWEFLEFSKVFTGLSNNTFSRDFLNNNNGTYKNVHYGDILIKYETILDIRKANIPYVNNDVNCNKYSLLQDGDIVIADTAEDDTVGKAVEVINVGNSLVISGLHTMAWRPSIEFAPMYLGYYINSNIYHKQLYPYMQGIKVTSINKSDLASTTILCPSYQEQQKIANCLSTFDEVIDKAKKKLDAYKKLKKGLLQQMFV